jgi:hypothetical protein
MFALRRSAFVPCEAARAWVDLQEPANGLGLSARSIRQALGGAARGRAQQAAERVGLRMFNE